MTSRRVAALAAVLALPMLGLALLLAEPDLDVRWQHQPAHFWLVLAAAALNVALAYATGVAARRRGDARVFLVSLGFLAAAGFLGLHALATPGVLLDGPNWGFSVATPVGLLVAAGFAAASSADVSGERGRATMRNARSVQLGLVALLVVWGIVSLIGLRPLGESPRAERLTGPLVVLAVAGVALYVLALTRYLRLYLRRPTTLLLGMVAGFTLLGEAMVAVAFGRNWHATWWEWHLLMLAAFAVIAWSAQRQWHEERFSPLYLDDTAAGTREISVLFADLQGFTRFSEQHEPAEVSAMLNAYFERAIPPVVRRHGGDIDRIIGDALMAVFNLRGDQPDHARRAARAALEIQQATAAVTSEQPGWPRFRVGVNTGEAVVGVVGAAGGRTYTAVGDAVNVAARIEAAAPVGGVALGPATVRLLPGARTESLGAINLKGKTDPVELHRLVDMP